MKMLITIAILFVLVLLVPTAVRAGVASRTSSRTATQLKRQVPAQVEPDAFSPADTEALLRRPVVGPVVMPTPAVFVSNSADTISDLITALDLLIQDARVRNDAARLAVLIEVRALQVKIVQDHAN